VIGEYKKKPARSRDNLAGGESDIVFRQYNPVFRLCKRYFRMVRPPVCPWDCVIVVGLVVFRARSGVALSLL
jgi:hypothetical protein